MTSASSLDSKNKETSSSSTTATVSARQRVEVGSDYRVVVFGSAGVGKSSLILRFVRGVFKDTYVPTIEDTYRQVITVNKSVFSLQITDTTGSHQFPAMQRLNIQKGHAFILVYSITNRQSVEELKAIYKDIVEIKGDDINNIPMMLIGSKCDEDANRAVTTTSGQNLAQHWNSAFLETSAKNNVNVTEAFEELIKRDTRNNLGVLNEKAANSSTIGKNSKTKKLQEDNGKRKCLLM